MGAYFTLIGCPYITSVELVDVSDMLYIGGGLYTLALDCTLSSQNLIVLTMYLVYRERIDLHLTLYSRGQVFL